MMTQTKKLYVLLAAILLLLSLVAKAESGQRVLIKGRIENFWRHKDKASSITCSVYEVAYRDHVAYKAQVSREGTFEISVPLDQASEIGLEFIGKFTAFAAPGDVIQLSLDADDPEASLTFKGDGAAYNNLRHRYGLALRNGSKELHKGYEQRYGQAKGNPEQFKQLNLEMLARRLRFLEEFGRANKAGKAFLDREKENLENATAHDLTFHGLNLNFPKSYFDDVFQRFPPTVPHGGISGARAMYLHNYYFYLKNQVDAKKYTPPLHFQRGASAFLSSSDRFTERERGGAHPIRRRCP